MPRVALLRPERDATERALSGVADRIRAELAFAPDYTPDLVLDDLISDRATGSAVDGLPGDTCGILFFGHGAVDRFGDPALVDVSTASRLAERIAIGMCCYSADQLGPAAMTAGARAFVGFDDWLVYQIPWGPFTTPMERALTGLLMIEGTVAECCDSLRDSFLRIEMQYGPGGPKGGSERAWNLAFGAHINWRGLRLLGDGNAGFY